MKEKSQYLESKYPIDKLKRKPRNEPRDYQLEMIKKTYDKLKQGETKIFLQGSPGSGKTTVMSEIVKDFTNKGYQVLAIAHRVEIIKQIEEQFLAQGVDMNYVTVHMVQTIRNKLDKIKQPKLIIIDEAHHAMAKTYLDILEGLNKEDTINILFSGTPYRSSGEGFLQIVPEDNLILGPTTKWLIQNNFLSDYDYYQPKIIDSNTLKFSAKSGDFTRQSIKKSSETIDPMKIVEYYKKLAMDKQGLVYAATIESSKEIVDAFNSCGISAYHLDGASDKEEREQMIKKYREGKIKILSNVELFTEGLDLPNAHVALIARPTMSLSLYLQFAMRVLRPEKNKKAIIIDFVGNAERLGLPDSNFKWTLRPHEVNEVKNVGLFVCPHCKQIYNHSELIGKFEVIDRQNQKEDNKEFVIKTMNLKLYCPMCDELVREEKVTDKEMKSGEKTPEEINNIIEDVENIDNKEAFEYFWKINKKITASDALDNALEIAFIQRENNSDANFKLDDIKDDLSLVKKVINIYLRSVLNTRFTYEELANSVNVIKEQSSSEFAKTITVDKLSDIVDDCREDIKQEKYIDMDITFENPLILNVRIAKAKSKFFYNNDDKFGMFLCEPLFLENRNKYESDLKNDLISINEFDDKTKGYYEGILADDKEKREIFDKKYYKIIDVRLIKYKTGNRGINILLQRNKTDIQELKLFCSKKEHTKLTRISKQNLNEILFDDNTKSTEKADFYKQPVDEYFVQKIKKTLNSNDYFDFKYNFYTKQSVLKKIKA